MECDRGADQRDPLGPVQCAAVISMIMSRVHARLEEAETVLADAWYMDDGQLPCTPDDVDTILRTLDEESAKMGAKRGSCEIRRPYCGATKTLRISMSHLENGLCRGLYSSILR